MMRLSQTLIQHAERAARSLSERHTEKFIEIEGAGGMFVAKTTEVLPSKFIKIGDIRLEDQRSDCTFTIYTT